MTNYASASSSDRVGAGQIAALAGAGIVGAVSGVSGSTILAIVLIVIERASPLVVGAWAGLLVASYLVQIFLCLAYRRNPAGSPQSWGKRFFAIALAEGVIWGVGVIVISASGSVERELVVILMSTGVGAGSALTFGSLPYAFQARFLPATLPYAVWCATQGNALHFALAVLTVVFAVAIVQLARQYNQNFVEMLRLRYENLDLIEGLRGQTEAANRANLSKSRFLASASHDLRQPVHAMNLFVGALQLREMDAEAQRIVSQIDFATKGLDELFASLLDISKLDAGLMPFHPQAFAIQRLIERVCKDYEAEAANKGVRLKLHPCSAFVRTEPIFLERILRNLVSNAVRYTAQGRVVVGCRRIGRRLSLQVWDTGAGIAESEQERVFEEFYQVDNQGRDRSKGLGLGLAIVKRLANLINAELTLVSRQGAGSVFKIAVPLAEAAPEEPAVATAPGGADRTGLIVVIDDEAAVQDGMRTLLTSWGHQVIAAGSGDEIIEKLSASPLRPDLIICDYRLGRGDDGVAVVRRLRTEYNDDALPALLITGDTAPDRLQQAERSGLLLLHKPVQSRRLAAVIGSVLARRGDAELDAAQEAGAEPS